MLALLAVLAVQAPEAARAESLLAAGQLPEARKLTERLVARSPRDPQLHLLLGRIWLAWPVIGRYQALAEFRTAARLAPHDPAPLYGQVEVGFFLGSDEGEVMAREALIKIFAIDPDYRDSWARFQQLYHNESIAQRAAAALARHPRDPIAVERRAELALGVGELERAESLAAMPPASVTRYVLRAEAAILRGADAAGQAWFDSALARADVDSAEILWDRAWTIASTAEAEQYRETASSERRAFFERFWGPRDPNLFTLTNERLVEHVRRTADANRLFRLLHPFRDDYRSPMARALSEFDRGRRVMRIAGGMPASAGNVAQAATLDTRSLQDTAHAHAYRAGLDARGLMFVRHGAPDLRIPCTPDPLIGVEDPNCANVFDGEGWLYWTPEGPLTVSFFGAEVFAPVSPTQLYSTAILLGSDRTTLVAPLDVKATTAFFAAPGGATQVYVRAAGDSAVLALWDVTGAEVARVRGVGLVTSAAIPDYYHIGVDVDSAGTLGRLRASLDVPDFAPGTLRLSSLVLAADSTANDRVAALRAMPATLVYQGSPVLGAYTEIYGLSIVDGAARYRARYTFEPERSFFGRLLRGRSPVSFEFERQAAGGEAVVERLLLEPGRVPPGRYRVTLAVTDELTNVKSETVALVVTLR